MIFNLVPVGIITVETNFFWLDHIELRLMKNLEAFVDGLGADLHKGAKATLPIVIGLNLMV